LPIAGNVETVASWFRLEPPSHPESGVVSEGQPRASRCILKIFHIFHAVSEGGHATKPHAKSVSPTFGFQPPDQHFFRVAAPLALQRPAIAHTVAAYRDTSRPLDRVPAAPRRQGAVTTADRGGARNAVITSASRSSASAPANARLAALRSFFSLPRRATPAAAARSSSTRVAAEPPDQRLCASDFRHPTSRRGRSGTTRHSLTL
jgi:hypothetical protein